MNDEAFISVLIPLEPQGPVADYVTEVHRALSASSDQYELVLLDRIGASADRRNEIRSVLAKLANVRYVLVSTRDGTEAAQFASMVNLIGDVVVILPWNTDPALIGESTAMVLEKNIIVFGQRGNRNGSSRLDRVLAAAFHRYMKHVVGLPLPERTTRFFAIGRKELNVLLKTRSGQRHMLLASIYTGIPFETLRYDDRGGSPNSQSFRQRLRLGIDVIVAATNNPLRVMSFFSVLISALNLMYIIYALLIFAFKKDVASGWSSLSLQNSFMFLFLFLALSVIAEYLGKILKETLDLPGTFVVSEQNSSVFLDAHSKLNIAREAARRHR